MEEYFKTFAKKIRTTEELIFSLEQITRIQRVISKIKKAPLDKKIKESANKELKEIFEKLENKKLISQPPEKQFSFLEKLKKYLLSFKEIKLEVAFHPSDRIIEKISKWVEKETGEKTILNISINPNIVGGAIIEYQGRWRDFSLAKKIDNLMIEKENG